MYYLHGIKYGLVLSFFLVVFVYLSSGILPYEVVELISLVVLVMATAALGYFFKLRKNLGVLQLFQKENQKYLLFPFGASTIIAITQASIGFLAEGNSLFFWVIPVGIVGQGLNISMFLLFGMWLCRRNNA